jgi:DivIVA domain-containing protein
MADSSSPAAVATASFSQSRKGYDPNEVRAYLQEVSAALSRAQTAEADARARLDTALVELEAMKDRPHAPAELDEATVSNLLGQEAARVLTTAREGAASLRARVEGEVETARVEAEREIAKQRADSLEEAARQRTAAEEEATLIRKNAAENSEREMDAAKSQGREMVLEARAYRERVMTDLARRREAARQQIEVLRLQRARLRASFSAAEIALSEIRTELADDIPDPDPVEDLTGISGSFPVVAAVTSSSSALAQSDSVATSAFAIGEISSSDPVETHPEELDPASEVEAEEPMEVVATATIDTDHLEPDNAFAGEINGGVSDPEVEAVLPEPDVAIEADEPPGEDESSSTEVAEVERAAPAHDHDHGGDTRPADDIFARIRAGRVTEVADLQEAPRSTNVAVATAPVAVRVEATAATEVLEARSAALTPLEAAVSKRLKRVLQDEQSEALDQLRRRKVAPAADELFGSSASYSARYQDAVRDDLQQAARVGAMSIGELSAPELTDIAAAEDVIGHALAEVDREMIQPLRAHLERSLQTAGDDADEAASQLRAVYREWKVQRIEGLVGHLVLTAHGRGVFAALVPGTPVCWIVDEAVRPCAEGDDNALAGSVPAGEEFPTGHRSAPAYAGCRCAIAPVSR